MKVLFFMTHVGYVRNFESTLRMLAARGHHVHLAVETQQERLLARRTLAEMARTLPNVTVGAVPAREDRDWEIFAQRLRHAGDYLRYFDPSFRDAPALRARARHRAPRFVRTATDRRLGRTAPVRRALKRTVRLLERGIPVSPDVLTYIREQAPDLVLVTPLLALGARQADYVTAARAAGVPVGLPVASWDNLTNKGIVHDPPDFVAVWNEAQKREATELHGVDPDKVFVTGAHSYDHWFGWEPSTTYEKMAKRVGLEDSSRYVLFVGSSPFIAPPPSEVRLVRRWVRALRKHDDPRLRRLGVLVRPHPLNWRQWVDADLGRNFAIWPLGGHQPIHERSKERYYDSIHHAVAVIGVNTSALIESAIVGRRIFTIHDEAFAHAQEGTLHYRHLLEAGGGLVTETDSVEQLIEKLGETLDQLVEDRRHRGVIESFINPLGFDEPIIPASQRRHRGFVESFLRPFGLDEPGTPRLIELLESEAAKGPLPARRPGLGGRLIGRVLAIGVRGAAEAEASRHAHKKERRRRASDRRRAARQASSPPEDPVPTAVAGEEPGS